MKNTPIKSFFVLLFMNLLSSHTGAADDPLEKAKERWFQIEVIVFQRTDLKDLHAEEWPETIAPIDIDTAIDFLSPIPSINGKRRSREVTPELLSPITEVINNNNPQNLIPAGKTELPFLPLAKDFHQMLEQRTSLSRSRNYRLLKHVAWRQPALGTKQAIPVRIIGGDDFSEKFNADGSEKQPSNGNQQSFSEQLALSKFLTDKNLESPEIDDFLFDFDNPNKELIDYGIPLKTALGQFNAPLPHIWELDGTIKISLRRYLHIDLQLALKKAEEKFIEVEQYSDFNTPEVNLFEQTTTTDIGLSWNTEDTTTGFQLPENDSTASLKIEYLQPYSLKQKRRVRSQEVHYFDHPLMGVLVLITPYDHKPEAEIMDDANDDSTNTNNKLSAF